jgi:hypothetical protein
VKEIGAMGWEKPDDTDPNSTNCLLNALGIKVHKERFKFHPYAYELANLVRRGYMDREVAVTRLEEEPDSEIVDTIRERLEKGRGTPA